MAGSGSLVVMSTDWPKIARGGLPYGACRDHTTHSFHGRAALAQASREAQVGGLVRLSRSCCLRKDPTGSGLSWGLHLCRVGSPRKELAGQCPP